MTDPVNPISTDPLLSTDPMVRTIDRPVGATASTVGANATGSSTTLKGKAGEAKEAISDGVKTLVANAGDAAAKGKDKAVEAASGLTRMLQDGAQTVDRQFGETYGDYVRTAATKIDGFADRVNNKNVDELVGDARNFLRKSPMVAVGAAAAAGFLIARLLKSGSDRS